ncbi:hypothetical protein GCM10027580_14000 [Corynebacterium faecale]
MFWVLSGEIDEQMLPVGIGAGDAGLVHDRRLRCKPALWGGNVEHSITESLGEFSGETMNDVSFRHGFHLNQCGYKPEKGVYVVVIRVLSGLVTLRRHGAG